MVMPTIEKVYRDNRARLIRALTPRCRTRDEAEDALHEAIARVMCFAERVTCHTEVTPPLLYTAAVNIVLDRRKQERAHARLACVAGSGDDEFSMSPEDVIHERERCSHISGAMTRLRRDEPRLAEAFMLRTQHELQWDEIGRRMGVGARMAQVYVYRAVEYCKQTDR